MIVALHGLLMIAGLHCLIFVLFGGNAGEEGQGFLPDKGQDGDRKLENKGLELNGLTAVHKEGVESDDAKVAKCSKDELKNMQGEVLIVFVFVYILCLKKTSPFLYLL